MNVEEFILLLIKRYGKADNEQIITDIKRFFTDKDADYDKLYDMIAEGYKYKRFPALADIKTITEKAIRKKTYGIDTVLQSVRIINKIIEESKNKTTDQILHSIKAIRYYQGIRELSVIEISFLHFWAALENFAGRLKDEEIPAFDIPVMCRNLKESLCRGEDDNGFYTDIEMEGQRTGLHKAVF